MLLDLWMGWLRIGIFGFGGGPSVVPLMRAECVSRYGWLTDAEFLETLALGNTLPGPIAVKMAVAIGAKAAGVWGAGVALLGLCLPGVALMLALSALFSRFRELPAVAGMLKGAKAAVVGMLAYTVVELAPDGVKDWRSGVLAAAALGGLLLEVHPVLVMGAALALGALIL
jgi:chromate transporter